MTAILETIRMWPGFFAAASVIASLALTLLVKYAKAPRLIVRVAIHKNKTTILRILLHNAEQSLDIPGLSVAVTLRDPGSVDPLPRVQAFAGPTLDGRVSLEPRLDGAMLLFHTERKLPPGRSWMLQMEFFGAVTCAVDCTVGPLVDAKSENAPRSTTLTVVPDPTGKPAIDQKDTLHPVLFPLVGFALALCIGAVALVVSLSVLGASHPRHDQVDTLTWGALVVLVMIASVVLHRLLRPIAPYVALGYRDASTLAMDLPRRTAASARIVRVSEGVVFGVLPRSRIRSPGGSPRR